MGENLYICEYIELNNKLPKKKTQFLRSQKTIFTQLVVLTLLGLITRSKDEEHVQALNLIENKTLTYTTSPHFCTLKQ